MSPYKSYAANIEAYFAPAREASQAVARAMDAALDVFSTYPPGVQKELAEMMRIMGRNMVEMADAWEKARAK